MRAQSSFSIIFITVLTMSLTLVGPAIPTASAQGPWPPITLNLKPVITGNRVTFEMKVTNQADWGLTDFNLKASIPPNTTFVEGHGDFDGASVSFDGQEVTFSVVSLPVGATLGYRYTVQFSSGSTPIYSPQIWASWKGRLPGQYLFERQQQPISLTPTPDSGQGVADLSTANGLQIVHVSGDLYEQGLERGQVLKEEIETQVKAQLALILSQGYNGDPKKWVEAIHTQVSQVTPEVMDELRGIADGSGVALNDLEIVNFSNYVMPAETKTVFTSLCSALAATNSATASGTLLIGRNQVLRNQSAAPLLLVRHFNDTRPPRCDLTLPASLEMFVSVTGNGLFWSGHTIASKEAIPAHATDNVSMISEALRNARTLDELQQTLVTQPQLQAMNMIVASLPQNEVRLLELSYTQYNVTQPDAYGLLASTDHFAAPALEALRPPTINQSLTRYDMLLATAQARAGTITPQVMQTIMHDPLLWEGTGMSLVVDAARMQLSWWSDLDQKWVDIALTDLFTIFSPVQ